MAKFVDSGDKKKALNIVVKNIVFMCYALE
jgi:hypothetical protein